MKHMCGLRHALNMFSDNISRCVQEHNVCIPNQTERRILDGTTHDAPSARTDMPYPNIAGAQMV